MEAIDIVFAPKTIATQLALSMALQTGAVRFVALFLLYDSGLVKPITYCSLFLPCVGDYTRSMEFDACHSVDFLVPV